MIDLAALPLWVYIGLKEKIGQRKAFEVMRVALLTGGTAAQNLQFDTVHKERTFLNGTPQLLVMAHYRMGFELTPRGDSSRVRSSIGWTECCSRTRDPPVSAKPNFGDRSNASPRPV